MEKLRISFWQHQTLLKEVIFAVPKGTGQAECISLARIFLKSGEISYDCAKGFVTVVVASPSEKEKAELETYALTNFQPEI